MTKNETWARWVEKNKEQHIEKRKISREKNKDKRRKQARERYHQIKEASDNWYKKIVTGWLPYHFGEEKYG